MQGKLIYFVGASGSGKDSVLNALSDANLDDVHIAKRYVTRKANHGEAHFCLSQAEFDAKVAADFFAMTWIANGLSYGIDQTIDDLLRAGKIVIVNGSRAYLPTALQRYPQLIPVCLQVSNDMLYQRLKQRGREDETAIQARLTRNSAINHHLPSNTLFIDNNGQLSQTLDTFIQHLRNLF